MIVTTANANSADKSITETILANSTQGSIGKSDKGVKTRIEQLRSMNAELALKLETFY
jgi:hypothetical protein